MLNSKDQASAPLGEARDAELARLRNWFQAAEESRAKNAALLDRALVDLAAARAEVSRLTADAERLDWLEKQLHDGDKIGDVSLWGSWTTQCLELGCHEETGVMICCPTIREAIDRARAATTEST